QLVEPRFMVTAGAIVLDPQGRVLLLKHRYRAGNGWGIPGGFLEKGEQPDEALRRELREEVGLELDTAQLVRARTLRRPRQVELHYLCRAQDAGSAIPQSREIDKAAWFDPYALPPEINVDQRRIIARALHNGARAGD
ncbi:MAG: NUDIX hydrolase, partial [Pyrinomonadaceae bacterium]